MESSEPKQNEYAVRIVVGGSQCVIQMLGWDVQEILTQLSSAALSGTPLQFIHDEEKEQATMIVPGPGMTANVQPWEQHVAAVERQREMQKAQTPGNGSPLVSLNRGFPRGAGHPRGRG